MRSAVPWLSRAGLAQVGSAKMMRGTCHRRHRHRHRQHRQHVLPAFKGLKTLATVSILGAAPTLASSA